MCSDRKHMHAKLTAKLVHLNYREEFKCGKKLAELLKCRILVHIGTTLLLPYPMGNSVIWKLLALATNPTLLLLDEPAAG